MPKPRVTSTRTEQRDGQQFTVKTLEDDWRTSDEAAKKRTLLARLSPAEQARQIKLERKQQRRRAAAKKAWAWHGRVYGVKGVKGCYMVINRRSGKVLSTVPSRKVALEYAKGADSIYGESVEARREWWKKVRADAAQ